MRKTSLIVLILLLAAIALISGGCVGVKEVQTPKLDVAGEDIQDVPRYPGSARIYYGPMPGIPNAITVVYVTSASIDTVADFYETELPVNGWKSEVPDEVMAQSGLVYRYVGQTVIKERQEVFIFVQDSPDYSGYTEINISFREQAE